MTLARPRIALVAAIATVLVFGAPTPGAGAATCAEAKAAVVKANQKVQAKKRALQRAETRPQRRRARRALRRAKRALAAAVTARNTACSNSGPPAAGSPVYLAHGDSVAAGGGTYVGLLYPHYQSTLGVGKLENLAQGGQTASGMRNAGGQLDDGVAVINAASDTRAVTIDIGGNDLLPCIYDANPEACTLAALPTYRSNLDAILGELRTALDADPGNETFVAMLYYNPYSGEANLNEERADDGLLGEDAVLDCDAIGNDIGMNDIISQEALANGALVANPYPAFKAGGQAYMSDEIHPNATGHAAIREAFKVATTPC